jgi:choice-of-anchor B domain-containing protein
VICEAAATQIFDISDPTNPDSIASISGGRHNGMVDGNYVYLVGGAFGGLQIYSIADPQNPTWVGEYDPFYYHDVAIHNDTLAACGIYGDGIDILDVTDKSSPQLVGHFNYANSGAHNAAFGEDGDYLFIGDEIGGGRYTRVFDISNFNDIQQVADIIVNSQAVTHNCYVLGNHLYIAHYAEGLRVWNIRRPYLPYEVAAYDTHPNEFAGFIGAWGVYPYFASGKIVISDMQLGLFAFNSTVKETVCCLGVRGNTNYDMDELNILDLLFLVNYIFRNGEEPACPEEGDVNGDGTLGNIIDLLYIVNVLYRSGPPPPACP